MTKSHIPEWVKQELAKADEAVARGKIEQAAQPRATAAHYDARKKVVVIELANGASFAFPPSLAQDLEGASAADLSEIEITPMGTGLHWPQLDADLTVDGLLAGVFGSRSWMRAHAARAGRARTPAKAAAARANGAKGGRPRKTTGVPA
jgi:uncharacterized protein RhaS with RHS repeats